MIPLDITKSAFLDAYWHRTTLVEYCRAKGLPTCGNKQTLTRRITDHLSGITPVQLIRAKRSTMPDTFTRATIIGDNWHCSQPLRAFFQSQIPTKFTFNKHMRDFIAAGKGKSLAEALTHWHATKNATPHTIEPQFEYNRFMRHFFQENKDADLATAITAWRIHRDTPKSQRA